MPAPDARILIVADGFLAELNTTLAGWGITTPQPIPLPPLAVTAQRKYSTQYGIEELRILHIDVQVVDLEETISDRKHVDNTYGFNVIVQMQVEPSDTAAIDELEKLTVAIFKKWKEESKIADFPTVSLIEKIPILYSPDLLDAKKRFFSNIGFVFGEITE